MPRDPAAASMRTLVCLYVTLILVGVGSCVPKGAAPKQLPAVSRPVVPLDAILTTCGEDDPWWQVIEAAHELHQGARVVKFDPKQPEAIIPELRTIDPEYALIVAPPEDIDVNFAWRWLGVASRLDADPFVDLHYGVITGATPEDAVEFLNRIKEVRADPSIIAPRLLDCLGPNQLDNDRVIVHRRLFWAGWLSGKIEARGMNNGLRGFADQSLDKLGGYGILHLGGHGYPDRIDQGLTAEQLARAQLSPCIVFNGACSTGVTYRAFEMGAGAWIERAYPSEQSFCLTMLRQPVIAYLAATHPDHGVPVYQEMEHWLTTGCTLGEVIKRTYDQLVVANGGAMLDSPTLADGQPMPEWGPKEIMLYGTASRLLYGDPTLRITAQVHEPGLSVASRRDADGTMHATITVGHPNIAFSLMNTFESDMAAQANGFNDRVYARIPLDDAPPIADVTARAMAAGKEVRSRVVGWSVEEHAGAHALHVQVDLESAGYQQGPIRRKGATVEITVAPRRSE